MKIHQIGKKTVSVTFDFNHREKAEDVAKEMVQELKLDQSFKAHIEAAITDGVNRLNNNYNQNNTSNNNNNNNNDNHGNINELRSQNNRINPHINPNNTNNNTVPANNVNNPNKQAMTNGGFSNKPQTNGNGIVSNNPPKSNGIPKSNINGNVINGNSNANNNVSNNGRIYSQGASSEVITGNTIQPIRHMVSNTVPNTNAQSSVNSSVNFSINNTVGGRSLESTSNHSLFFDSNNNHTKPASSPDIFTGRTNNIGIPQIKTTNDTMSENTGKVILKNPYSNQYTQLETPKPLSPDKHYSFMDNSKLDISENISEIMNNDNNTNNNNNNINTSINSNNNNINQTSNNANVNGNNISHNNKINNNNVNNNNNNNNNKVGYVINPKQPMNKGYSYDAKMANGNNNGQQFNNYYSQVVTVKDRTQIGNGNMNPNMKPRTRGGSLQQQNVNPAMLQNRNPNINGNMNINQNNNQNGNSNITQNINPNMSQNNNPNTNQNGNPNIQQNPNKNVNQPINSQNNLPQITTQQQQQQINQQRQAPTNQTSNNYSHADQVQRFAATSRSPSPTPSSPYRKYKNVIPQDQQQQQQQPLSLQGGTTLESQKGNNDVNTNNSNNNNNINNNQNNNYNTSTLPYTKPNNPRVSNHLPSQSDPFVALSMDPKSNIILHHEQQRNRNNRIPSQKISKIDVRGRTLPRAKSNKDAGNIVPTTPGGLYDSTGGRNIKRVDSDTSVDSAPSEEAYVRALEESRKGDPEIEIYQRAVKLSKKQVQEQFYIRNMVFNPEYDTGTLARQLARVIYKELKEDKPVPSTLVGKKVRKIDSNANLNLESNDDGHPINSLVKSRHESHPSNESVGTESSIDTLISNSTTIYRPYPKLANTDSQKKF